MGLYIREKYLKKFGVSITTLKLLRSLLELGVRVSRASWRWSKRNW